ncbi:MAG: CvpA family protein [Candidatus Cloacimonetes bacterium]|jgi:uncharacterized membrane protein required for colicin V production|nr:CvpA family protein [Candidatus Cloacimonadota bacterium]MDD4156633.1 CvpA family protein [Candidatus Cloacimonadota bacterium]
MHTVDIILIIIFLVSMLLGFKKGFISAIITWIGLLVSLLMIVRFGPMVQAGIEFKLSIGSPLSKIIAYVLIFILISILGAILKILLNYIAKLLNLSLLNRTIGAIFGLLNCMIVIIFLLFIIDFLPYVKPVKEYLNDSAIITEMQKIKKTIIFDLKEKNLDVKI